MKLEEVILRPLITEKSMKNTSGGFYGFEVNTMAKKNQIKEAVERFFKVKVLNVRIIKKRGKSYRVGRYRHEKFKKDRKTAMVALKKGEKIGVFASQEG